MSITYLDSSCQANIAENFRRVESEIESGGGLPAIESGDAGKVLTVNNDEDAAVWATPSGGGGGALVVNATVSGSTGTLDKTAGEIYSVLEGGGIVACKFELVADEIVLWFIDTYYTFDEQYGYQFVFRHVSDTVDFTAVTANDYPTAELQ